MLGATLDPGEEKEERRGGEERSRGATTLQLVQTPEGWRVANWIWTGEVDGVPLPRGG